MLFIFQNYLESHTQHLVTGDENVNVFDQHVNIRYELRIQYFKIVNANSKFKYHKYYTFQN